MMVLISPTFMFPAKTMHLDQSLCLGSLTVFFVMFHAGKETRMKKGSMIVTVYISGDGTIRKNEKIWNNWSPASGLQLHP
jgi:hypothetical protein